MATDAQNEQSIAYDADASRLNDEELREIMDELIDGTEKVLIHYNMLLLLL